MLQSMFIIYKDMMRWCQKVLGRKNINVNKVLEAFDTCWWLCMMSLKEVEQLTVDLFIKYSCDNITTVCTDETSPLLEATIGMMYKNYGHDLSSKYHHRNYMLVFVNIASKFKNYWLAVNISVSKIISTQFIWNINILIIYLCRRYA